MSEEQSDHTMVSETVAGEVEPELPRGSQINRYVVLDCLGRGGMGVVYRAYDPQLDRSIALKLIKRVERDPREHDATRTGRLLREAKALAQLNHPHVVAVHDVGTVGDDVFVAMEFVAGKSLNEWRKECDPSLQEVLDVMLAAGSGLAAAHKQGLVHRDFKPANVIVGDDGRVRVIDFGLARTGFMWPSGGIVDKGEIGGIDAEIDSAETRSGAGCLQESVNLRGSTLLDSALTRVGTLLGTPAYMAPEQLVGGQLDGRADQFSYCLVLYELLYGQRPFSGRSVAELVDKVRAGRMQSPPAEAGVPQWLQSIVTRGLAVEPGKRYPSMEDLLDKLINNPEEELRRQSLARRRRTIWLSAASAILLVVALMLALRACHRAEIRADCEAEAKTIDGVWNREVGERIAQAFAGSEVHYAKDTWSRAWPHVDDYVSRWKAARRMVCLQGMLDKTRSVDMLSRARSCFDEQKARIRSLAAQWSSPNKTIIQKTGTSAQSFPFLRFCVDETELSRRAPVPTDPAAVAAVKALREQLAQAEALKFTGQHNKALSTAQKVLSKALELDLAEIAVSARLSLGDAQEMAGHYTEAKAAIETALYEADVAGDDLKALGAASALITVVGYRLAQHEEGVEWYRLAEGKMGRLALEPSHPDVVKTLNYRGLVNLKKGDYEQAEKMFQRCLLIREKTLGPDHPDVANTLNNLGIIYRRRGDHEQAEKVTQRALSIRQKALGPDHPDVAHSLNNLGLMYQNKGDHDQAEKMYQRALSIREKTLGSDHPLLAFPLNNLGNVYSNKSDYRAAEKMYQRALSIWEKALGPDHPNVAWPLTNLGIMYDDKGDLEKAEKMYQRALSVWEKALGPDHPLVAHPLTNLGAIRLAQKRFGKAREILQRVREICGRKTCDADTYGKALFSLAKVLVASEGDTGRAVELAQQAREVFKKTPKRLKEELEEVNAWLQEHGNKN